MLDMFLIGLAAVMAVAFFLLLNAGMLAVTALTTKWTTLVDRFSAQKCPAVERSSKPLRLGYIYFDVRGSMGPGLLPAKMWASSEGLSVSPWFPIRCLCDPLFIPWGEFSGVSKEWYLLPHLWVSVGDPVVADLMLPVWVERQMP